MFSESTRATSTILPDPSALPAASRIARRRRTVGNVLLWVLQLLLGLFFVYGGLNKLLGLQQEQEIAANFAKFGLGPWFRYFVATLELLGGLGLLVPRLAGVAALLLAGVMFGAVVSHLTILKPALYASIPAVLVCLFVLIAVARRAEIRALVGKWVR